MLFLTRFLPIELALKKPTLVVHVSECQLLFHQIIADTMMARVRVLPTLTRLPRSQKSQKDKKVEKNESSKENKKAKKANNAESFKKAEFCQLCQKTI